MKKTNAMRILEKNNVNYEVIEYSSKGGISGVEVAKTLKEDVYLVYKTLVTESKESYYVFVIPVYGELDLKKAAIVSGEKKIEMLPQKNLLSLTGYVHGGCSPVGMKKLFTTFIDETAKSKDYFFVSGGKVGMQIKVNPVEVANLINAKFADLVKGETSGL
ncbi:Cys-tRNA(Pro)/Cys-tRNA(Cys) deacylase [Anaerosphaera aminiphila DSM 21120]|uniref:Cys-tRNA(Pro)/Cys-tRNA(Cys) deacylase n=1 Tax=Anaerosphaera aminiphila DSM 21120 TaxID=1120995 RepID=A0A1M5U0F8_9FIRM|nr:Cys-tRNA(Pro) deacylase [Anaerosphaera aminiphila]SHH56340.1 Cys-tRNA(Pro)/Cys-tRNA(Cys) deacylase [Anaerosphaera aminiphila DSM 21120]